MAIREGSWWSRAWGTVALSAFGVHLGGAVYEAAVIAPLWSVQPPTSVTAWNALQLRPDSSTLFEPLVAVVVLATLMSWISGITTRGWRRWWLTLAVVAAGALAAVTFVLVMPSERDLFGARSDADAAAVIAWTGDWLRAAAFRFAALLVGTWAVYRAQLAGALADVPVAGRSADFVLAEPGAPVAGRVRRPREFSFGDEGEPEISLGEEAVNPRQRWRQSLPASRRTAKK